MSTSTVHAIHLIEKKLIYDRFTTILDTRNKGKRLIMAEVQTCLQTYRPAYLSYRPFTDHHPRRSVKIELVCKVCKSVKRSYRPADQQVCKRINCAGL